MCACVCIRAYLVAQLLFATPWTVACQAHLSVEFSRQEYWSGLPFPSPEDLPDLGIEPASLTSPALAGRFFTTALGKSYVCMYVCMYVDFPGGSVGKNLPAMQETQVRSLGREDPLQESMVTHSSTLAWRIPWIEEPGGLQCIGLQSQTGLKQLSSSIMYVGINVGIKYTYICVYKVNQCF